MMHVQKDRNQVFWPTFARGLWSETFKASFSRTNQAANMRRGPITWSRLARLTEMNAFTRDPGVNRSYNVLYTFDYMASGLARLAEIPSAAYRASPAKRAGS